MDTNNYKDMITKASQFYQSVLPTLVVGLLGWASISMYQFNGMLREYIAASNEKHLQYEDRIESTISENKTLKLTVNNLNVRLSILESVLRLSEAIRPREDDEEDEV